jgi:hypothetical protein
MARILDQQGQALDEVSRSLEQISVPDTPTLVELTSARGALSIASRETARATERILLHTSPDAYPALIPSLRKAAGSGVTLSLSASAAVELPFAQVEVVAPNGTWPGQPFLLVVDSRSALLAAREGERVLGHWGTAPTLVAATALAIGSLRGGA